MIIVKLIGGLGNQMFQYALGRKLAILKDVQLKLDISWYVNSEFGRDVEREYSLNHFNIVECLASEDELKPYLKKKSLLFRIARKIRRELSGVNNVGYDPKILESPDGSYIDGFWQSEKYFADIADIIRHDFTLKNELSDFAKTIKSQAGEVNSVSLHVRRGDFVSDKKVNSLIGSCGIDYYHSAIRLVSESIEQPCFFVFSDDIEWVKANLETEVPMIYVSRPELRDYEELILMSMCKHNIVANSSFSWWGAWLNINPGKMVIAPKRWFASNKMGSNELVPESWIRI